MTTVFVDRDGSGKIHIVYSGPQPDLQLEEMDDSTPEVMDFLASIAPIAEGSFPALKKWQLWLAALQLTPPIFKVDVLAAVNAMADMSAVDKETVRIMVEDAQEYSRGDPRIDLLGQAMGIPASQMDDLWRWAAQIQSM